jgi:hypothetical protein
LFIDGQGGLRHDRGMHQQLDTVSRRLFIGGATAATFLAASPLAAAPAPQMITTRSPTCGCCMKWVEAMQKDGFRVAVRTSDDMAAVKSRLKVPSSLYSCHTTVVGGLVVEGHVPASAIRTLLARKPKGVIGISAPGMPRGAPGMEMADGSQDPLNLTLFDAGGRTRPFA